MLTFKSKLHPSLIKAALLVAVLLASLLTAGVLVLVKKIPFRKDRLIREIETRTNARISIGEFRQTWFPPGFDARQIRVTDAAGEVLTIDSAEIEASYTGLLRTPGTLRKLHTKGMRLTLPADAPRLGLSRTFKPGGSGGALAVDEIRMEDATLAFRSSASGRPPVEFLIHSITLRDVGRNTAVKYSAALRNPKPEGEVHIRGDFGPVDMNTPGHTPVSGDFTFEKADLTLPRAISGVLNAKGSFRGPLTRLECAGTADVPRFQVVGSSHPVHVAAEFNAAVNGATGDTALNRIVAHYNDTTVLASGSVARRPGREGRTVDLNTRVDYGRVEDLLILFTSRPLPAMQGPITFQAKFLIPPGPPGFLTRLSIDGHFDIRKGRFTNPHTQTPINRLSASAEGEPKQQQREHPTLAAVDVHGDVVDRNGVARLANVVFQAPGVRGSMDGTFTLRQRQIDLRGTIETAGKLGDTTNGIKTLMLKAIGPFWPKRASIQLIPFTVTGSSSHPVFRLRLRQ